MEVIPVFRSPCLRCGVCCTLFRVSFYYREADSHQPGGVPAELCEDLTPFRLVMRGTNQRRPRCVALVGDPGIDAHCGIYPARPSVCREFEASYEDGVTPNPDCDRARVRFGLPPLTPADWIPSGDKDPAPPEPEAPLPVPA